ncbi:MAG: nitrogenase-stabilizing/protective protein NifW [Candidatus Sedimenticola endophacoides]
MNNEDFELDLDELSSAEDFLEYFGIEFEPAVVHVNRLHILQRFHDYLESAQMPESADEKFQVYAAWLLKAYADFVDSDAMTEKVFKVFKMLEPVEIMVPLSDLLPGVNAGAAKV